CTYHTYGRNPGWMTTRAELLDHAIAVLRRGEVLTLDAVATESGLIKGGAVHEWGSIAEVRSAVAEHNIEGRESAAQRLRGPEADRGARLRAYVEHALTGSFDASDLAVLADPHLRERMRTQWIERLTPWLGAPAQSGPRPAGELAARLLADGAWFNQALGVPVVDEAEREPVRRLALALLAGEEGPTVDHRDKSS